MDAWACCWLENLLGRVVVYDLPRVPQAIHAAEAVGEVRHESLRRQGSDAGVPRAEGFIFQTGDDQVISQPPAALIAAKLRPQAACSQKDW